MVCVSAPGFNDVFPAFHLRELTDDLQEVAEQATQGWDCIQLLHQTFYQGDLGLSEVLLFFFSQYF